MTHVDGTDAREVTVEHRAPTLAELCAALELHDATQRFTGTLQYMRVEEPGDPPTWRTMGPHHGACSPVIILEGIRFLLGDSRVLRIRVVKLPMP